MNTVDFGEKQSRVLAEVEAWLAHSFNIGLDLDSAGRFLVDSHDRVDVAAWEWSAEADARCCGRDSVISDLQFYFWTEALRQFAPTVGCSADAIIEFFWETSASDQTPETGDPLHVCRNPATKPKYSLFKRAEAEVEAIDQVAYRGRIPKMELPANSITSDLTAPLRPKLLENESDQSADNDASPKQLIETPASPSPSQTPGYVLCRNAMYLLEALHDAKAFDPDSRITIGKASTAAVGKGSGISHFGEIVTSLKAYSFVETALGSTGGVWLTPQGRARAQKLKDLNV